MHNNKTRKRHPFSPKEDKQLSELVRIHGENVNTAWELIANEMKGRNARQCRERYNLFLNDKIKKNVKWTKEEDDLLLSKFAFFGPHWKIIEKYFNGRTSYNIKNRFRSLQNNFKKNCNNIFLELPHEISQETEIQKSKDENQKNDFINNFDDEDFFKDMFQSSFINIDGYFYDLY